MTLKRVRVYSVSDGDGHFDQMDEYSERGEYYYADDADREIKRLRAMTEWQPMRTAPRDGTLVTLWHRCGSLIAGIAWNADEQKWYGMPEEEFVGWILLPTPPQTKASAEPQEKP
jgi:hypothetical protein